MKKGAKENGWLLTRSNSWHINTPVPCHIKYNTAPYICNRVTEKIEVAAKICAIAIAHHIYMWYRKFVPNKNCEGDDYVGPKSYLHVDIKLIDQNALVYDHSRRCVIIIIIKKKKKEIFVHSRIWNTERMYEQLEKRQESNIPCMVENIACEKWTI